MNHPEAVNVIKMLAPRFKNQDVEDVLTKYASANDLSPAQLAKLGQTYNTLSALSTYAKAADRGATAHSVDVPSLVSGYASPMRKAASSHAPSVDPLPTHGDHIDLYDMFRRTLSEERSKMPDEAKKDRDLEAENRNTVDPKDDNPSLELLQDASDDLNNTIDVQSVDLLRKIKKSAGVYDLAAAEEDAKHRVASRFVDAAMRRIEEHAAGQAFPAVVSRMKGPLEKRAFVVCGEGGKLVAEIALNMATLDQVNRMLKEAAEKHRRPKSKQVNLFAPSSDEADDGGDKADVPAPEPVLVGAADAPADFLGGIAPKKPAPSSGFSFGSPSDTLDVAPEKPEPEGEEESQDYHDDEEVSEEERSDDQGSEGEGSGQAHGDGSGQTQGSGRTGTPQRGPQGGPPGRPPGGPGNPPRSDKKTKPGKSDTTSTSGDSGSKGMSVSGLLSGLADIPIGAAKGLADLVHGAQQVSQAKIDKAISKGGVNLPQAHVDASVDDVRRSFLLRRLMNTDEVLREAAPMKVAKYYNILADAFPDLASNPDTLKLLLRESVAYDGLPVETIKNLTAARLDRARAIKEERDVRDLTYRI